MPLYYQEDLPVISISVTTNAYNMEKIGKFTLTDKIIKKMRDKIERNNKIKRELGFSLFQKNNILIDRWHCVGTKTSISPSDKCKNGEELVGGFHTHPEANSEPSLGDLLNAYREGLECIGGFLDKKIVCHVRKVEFDKGHLDDINLTREKLGRMQLNAKWALEDFKDPKYMDEYKEKREKEKERILEKYFDSIEII